MMYANHHQSRRTDIDGLRALAILPVVLYHARLGCPGGYVGVDIFFVISGYVITSLILKEQEEGVFSLIGFWERRIRRIFPAMALMLGGTFLLGWFLFLPEDFQLTAKSAIAQAAMLSNVFFYLQLSAGNAYFGPNADTVPLLHTWSLSVEEQFYLFFPILMTLALNRRRLLRVLGVAGLLSFLMSVWYFVPQYYDPLSFPGRHGALFQFVFGYWHRVALSVAPGLGAFFLLPPRAWELLLGALLALARGRLVIEKGVRELLGWLGLGMIGFAIFCYNDKTPFPGITAIPPCLGAALIIFANEGNLSLTGRLLSVKPVVFIGLISYSLYLWHWPLLVFDKYPAFIKPGPWQRAMVLAVSFGLACLSWKFVETPFRTRKMFPRRGFLFTFAGCTASVFLALGFWVYSSGGAPARFSPEVNRCSAFRNHFAEVLRGRVIELGVTNSTPFDLMVWGDSHATAVAPVINDLCHRYSLHGALAADSLTAPVMSATGGKWQNKGSLANVAFDLIIQRHIKVVILAASWHSYLLRPQFKKRLVFTVQTLLRTGARVYVIKDVPRPGFDVPQAVSFSVMHGQDLSLLGTTPAEYSDLNKPMDETFDQLSKMGATVLDPTTYFINSHGLYAVVKDNQALYWDGDHLSAEGAALLAPMFEPIFRTNRVLTSSQHEGRF